MAISPKRFIALGITVTFIASAFSNQVNAMKLIDSIKMDSYLNSQLNLLKSTVNKNIELSSDGLLKILKLNDNQIEKFNQKTRELLTIPEVAEFFQAQMAIMPVLKTLAERIAGAVGFDSSAFNGVLGNITGA